MTGLQSAEFSRPVLLRSLRGAMGDARREVVVTATDAECARVAKRLGVSAIASLSCRYALSMEPRDSVLAEGALTACLSQDCVLTLDVFEDVIVESFVVRFVPEANLRPDPGADLEELDEIPYEGDSIDLGEATVEQLALMLDPYPRRPGAKRPDAVISEEDAAQADEEEAAVESVRRPFAGLGALRRDRK